MGGKGTNWVYNRENGTPKKKGKFTKGKENPEGWEKGSLKRVERKGLDKEAGKRVEEGKYQRGIRREKGLEKKEFTRQKCFGEEGGVWGGRFVSG